MSSEFKSGDTDNSRKVRFKMNNLNEENKEKLLMVTMHKGQMKIGKGAGNINVFETYNIAKILEIQGFDVTIATTVDTDIAVAYDKLDVNSFDKVLVMNALVDFPGGEENKMIDALFRFLKPYKGVIYNLLVDLAIPFKQLYPLVKDRKWNKYQTAEEINLDNEFIILSQASNINEVRRIYENSGVNIKDIRYVPINEWILHTNDFIENTGEVDLIMGTSFRKGKRTQKYIDYFLRRNDISVELFGSITEKHFKGFTIPNNVTFTPKLKDVSKVIEKNATGYSTVIIGDPNYNNNNIITLRFAESLLANCITFIDNDFDRQHKIYPNLPFMYVKNGDDLERKIKYLKANPKFHKAILKIQHNKVEEIRKNNFPKLLENAILENQIQERNDYKWII